MVLLQAIQKCYQFFGSFLPVTVPVLAGHVHFSKTQVGALRNEHGIIAKPVISPFFVDDAALANPFKEGFLTVY